MVIIFDLEALRRDRDQLWAEAVEREAKGESIRLDEKLWPAAAEVQAARQIDDPWIGDIGDALGDHVGKIRSADVWTIVNIPIDRRTQEHNARLGDAMQALGWTRDKLRFGGKHPERCYVKGFVKVKVNGEMRFEVQPPRIIVERIWNESARESVLAVSIEGEM
ncbi:MAG: hypothetical protein E5Y73_35620 [Mesorhizobium sp.]|nr:MAG: hypothetical protein E5Y73_35620 [Mesorhizobium sp.]